MHAIKKKFRKETHIKIQNEFQQCFFLRFTSKNLYLSSPWSEMFNNIVKVDSTLTFLKLDS